MDVKKKSLTIGTGSQISVEGVETKRDFTCQGTEVRLKWVFIGKELGIM